MYLGIDLGTSGLKAVLIDDAQTLVAEATAPLTVSRPHPSWSEQHPADWIEAARGALGAIAAEVPLDGVRAIGLSGQMHGATLLDASHTVLRPAILWNDTRAADEAITLDATPVYREVSGNIVFPGFTAPKLNWVRRHEPALFDEVALVLLPKDFLRLWLTGEAVTEPSDASGTSWLDTGARVWSPELLELCALDVAHMPRIVEGNAPSGALRGEIAREFGLPAGIPVAGGAGDNAGAAVGMGVVSPGDAFLSLGTSGVLFVASPGYRPAPETAVHTFCHALPDAWHQMGVILSATDALNWYAGFVGKDAASLAGGLGPLTAPGRALFLPYLGGERTPHNDAAVRGALIGIAHDCDTAAGTRAVMEGVVHAVRDCRDALAAAGTTFDRLIAVGGGSRSAYWLEAMATSLGVPIDLPGAGDYGAAFGAARLAIMAATGEGAALATRPEIARTIEPNAALASGFADAHARYQAAYQALKDIS
ncbi:xylulokinase [Acuticoccus kandeliae]|uniref:xylulokinase n=1 Tax=Acuticoccus kandeliae TaxID=2073160 RepID=UPI000D3E8E42|nr:xylulokinase [Acuticoccus kandeliae]